MRQTGEHKKEARAELFRRAPIGYSPPSDASSVVPAHGREVEGSVAGGEIRFWGAMRRQVLTRFLLRRSLGEPELRRQLLGRHLCEGSSGVGSGT